MITEVPDFVPSAVDAMLAVIVACPSAFPVTTPADVTDATMLLLDE